VASQRHHARGVGPDGSANRKGRTHVLGSASSPCGSSFKLAQGLALAIPAWIAAINAAFAVIVESPRTGAHGQLPMRYEQNSG
jgi:hypothetical protein